MEKSHWQAASRAITMELLRFRNLGERRLGLSSAAAALPEHTRLCLFVASCVTIIFLLLCRVEKFCRRFSMPRFPTLEEYNDKKNVTEM